MIVVDNISFSYSDTKILKNVSLTIQEGEMLVIGGPSGCGKTTLLRHLKAELMPLGKRNGKIWFQGQEVIENLNTSSSIGYVFQHPDDQIVSDKVYHEISFGLENQKQSLMQMNQKVAEILHYFDIFTLYKRDTDSLSGGQKQLLNLASVLVMQPQVILLDEPLSQLDPSMQEVFMHMVQKIHQETETTIVIVEHHFERVLPYCDTMLLLKEGEVTHHGYVDIIVEQMLEEYHPLVLALPEYYRLYPKLQPLPKTIKDARVALRNATIEVKRSKQPELGDIKYRYQDIYVSYQQDVLKGLHIDIYDKDILAVIGSNGSGKTTLLKVLAGIEKGQFKKKNYKDQIGYVSQDPTLLFMKDSVKEELYAIPQVTKQQVQEVIKRLGIESVLSYHPYDVSGGYRQLVALAKVLLMQPKLLLLDEPTKGLDAHNKRHLGELLCNLSQEMSIVMVSHDLDFVAKYSKRCGMLFDGKLESIGYTREVLQDNTFYTTIARKMTKGIVEDVLVYEDIDYEIST